MKKKIDLANKKPMVMYHIARDEKLYIFHKRDQKEHQLVFEWAIGESILSRITREIYFDFKDGEFDFFAEQIIKMTIQEGIYEVINDFYQDNPEDIDEFRMNRHQIFASESAYKEEACVYFQLNRQFAYLIKAKPTGYERLLCSRGVIAKNGLYFYDFDYQHDQVKMSWNDIFVEHVCDVLDRLEKKDVKINVFSELVRKQLMGNYLEALAHAKSY